MAQTLGFDPTLKVKTCLNRENGPRGRPSHEAFSVSPQGTLEISSTTGQPPSLLRDHFNSPRPSPQRPQYPYLYRCLKQKLEHSLRASLYKRSVVRQGKEATHT